MKLLILFSIIGCVFAAGEMWCQVDVPDVFDEVRCYPINAPPQYQSISARDYPRYPKDPFIPYGYQASPYGGWCSSRNAYCLYNDNRVLGLCTVTLSGSDNADYYRTYFVSWHGNYTA